jgi:sec-independent protein translocase protein TatA
MPFGGVELIVLLAIILLFFGAKRVPQLAKSLGTGARELKKAASEDADEGEKRPASEGTNGGEAKAAPQGAYGDKPGAVAEAAPSERDGAGTEGREPREN